MVICTYLWRGGGGCKKLNIVWQGLEVNGSVTGDDFHFTTLHILGFPLYRSALLGFPLYRPLDGKWSLSNASIVIEY